ncbi:enoyl-CoA hydratase/isomerase family protein [Candidatus Poribacteria bacterium]|nr:enoyl-CoA hydratase/isomerase family protein [Candidatus Poribacteria bacterium]
MEFEDITYEKKDGIARVTINRPKVLNAFRSKTLDELAFAFDDAGNDAGVGVVVLSGAGEKAFCAGGDISEMGELSPSAGRKFLGKCVKASTAIRNCSKPVIAMVRGYCMGGGHEIHLMCDLTIAGESAQFGQTGPTVGSVPIWGGTQMLPRVVGEKKAREIIFLCKRYSARQAEEMGLVNKVVPDDKLEEETMAWCKRILEMSPQALSVAKVSLNFESDLLYASFVHGAEMLRLVYGTEEIKEGMSAFLQKRKPDFGKFRK